MSLLYLGVVHVGRNKDEKPAILSSAGNYSRFGYFEAKGVTEFCKFFSRTIASRVPVGARQQFEKRQWSCYVHPRHNGLRGVVIASQDYPERVAFSLCYKLLRTYESEIDLQTRLLDTRPLRDNCLPWVGLEPLMIQYQTPEDADDLMAIQGEISQVQKILNAAMESVMKRDETLERLVQESGDLSYMSKKFYTDAQGENSTCCFLQ